MYNQVRALHLVSGKAERRSNMINLLSKGYEYEPVESGFEQSVVAIA